MPRARYWITLELKDDDVGLEFLRVSQGVVFPPPDPRVRHYEVVVPAGLTSFGVAARARSHTASVSLGGANASRSSLRSVHFGPDAWCVQALRPTPFG